MDKEHDILFSLLRTALWGTRPENLPDDIPWEKVVSDARRQTVLGLVCDALQALPQEKQPSGEMMTRLL